MASLSVHFLTSYHFQFLNILGRPRDICSHCLQTPGNIYGTKHLYVFASRWNWCEAQHPLYFRGRESLRQDLSMLFHGKSTGEHTQTLFEQIESLCYWLATARGTCSNHGPPASPFFVFYSSKPHPDRYIAVSKNN